MNECTDSYTELPKRYHGEGYHNRGADAGALGYRVVNRAMGNILQPVTTQEWARMVQEDIEKKTKDHPLSPVTHLISEGVEEG